MILCLKLYLYTTLCSLKKLFRENKCIYNRNKDSKVFYSCDWHSKSNKSFKVNGGIWSVHCLENEKGSELHQKKVIVCGIASEYCVRETIKELLKHDFKVSLLLDGIGYVDKDDHNKNIEELKSLDVNII